MCKLGVFVALFLVLLLNQVVVYASEDPFPLFSGISKNVDFWKKVYTEYPSSRGYVHDTSDPTIIYQVVDLLTQDDPASRKKNKKRVKEVTNKWRKVLIKLAQGEEIEVRDRKQLEQLWPNASSLVLKEAADNIRFQTCQRDRFSEGLKRSGRYLELMRHIISGYGLPADLAYLPHVESSFNYKAYSKFGAAGIWQFMRTTGRRYLTIDYSLDERRDPILATHAAGRLLKENYEKLGCWALALTAYNYGENGMMRAKKELGNFDRIIEKYSNPRFGFASKNFYAEFLAAREVAKNYRKYFPGLMFDSPVSSHEIKLDDYFSIKALADYFGVRMVVIQQLNPGLRRPVYNGQKYVPKGYVLRLPKTKKITRLAGSIPNLIRHQKQKRSLFYRVRRGDTAGKIAKEHDVKLRDLIESNNLGKRAIIFIGQNLIIPQVGSKVVPLARQVEKKAKPAIELTMNSGTVVSGQPLNGGVVIGNFDVEDIGRENEQIVGYIKVLAQETLSHYASWLSLETKHIRQLNNLPFGKNIKASQRIKIPLVRGKKSKSSFEEQRYEFHKEFEEDFFSAYKIVGMDVYAIKKGDNIWALCHEKLYLPFWLVKKYNSTVNFEALRINQVLVLPVIEKLS